MAIYFRGLSIVNDVDLWNHLAALDRLLANAEFARLETVKIVIGVILVSPHGVQDLLRKALPYLEGSGKLVILIERGELKKRRRYTWPRSIWKHTSRARI